MKSAWIALLLTAAVSIQAQNLTEQITINAVEVPVYVTGPTGAPIEGLTRADFELRVNGRLHPIDYFDVVSESAGASTVAKREAPRDLRRRRLVLLLFDPLNSTMNAIHRAQQSAQTFIDSAPAEDTFGVAVTRDQRIELAVPFTADRVAVKRAIATLRPSRSGDALNLATLDAERRTFGIAMNAGSDRLGPESETFQQAEPAIEEDDSVWMASHLGGQSVAALQDAKEDEREVYAALQVNETERWMALLGALAERLEPLEGAKHVVLLREGGVDHEFIYAISSLHARFRKAGVILDAVDIGGLRAPWGRSASDGTSFLRGLAVPTGGTMSPSLESLRAQQRVSYIVGFVPPKSGKSWNTISVRLKNTRVGTHIRHRLGYSTERRESRADSLVLADVVLNDIPQNGMTVDVHALPAREGAMVVAQVPGVEVLALGEEGATTLDAFLYVFDEQNAVTAWTQVRLRVDHEKGRDFLATSPYTIRRAFRLGPGRYSAKALVRVVGKDVTGFGRGEFEVAR